MQAKAKLYDIETFGKEGQFHKAVFIDYETMDKVGVMVNTEQLAALRTAVGKEGVLSVGLQAEGFNYKVSFKAFKC